MVAFATGPLLAAARDEWRYVRTENFEVFSSASEKKTRELVMELEQFRASFIATFRLRPAYEPRVTVMLFDSERRFTPYMPVYQGKPKEVAGYFAGGPDEALIALNLDASEGEDGGHGEIIFHEYVHFLLHSRGLRLPTWLNEGLAELFSTFQVNGDKVEYGRAKQLYVDVLNLSSLMAMPRLMAVTENSPEYNEETRAGMFYAQAWALTHYLVCGENRANADKLHRYLTALDAAGDDASAVSFKDAFGSGFDKLEYELRNYLRGGTYYKRNAPVPLKDFGTRLTIRAATPSERDLALLNLSWRVHGVTAGMPAALRAVQENPTSWRAQEIFAVMEASKGDLASAAARWRKAAGLGSTNPFTLVQAARAKLADLGGMIDPEGRLGEVDASQLRLWLDRVVRNHPQFDDAWELLGVVEAHAPQFRAGVVNELQRHVDLMKDRNPLLLSLALIRWRNDDKTSAASIVDAVLESSRAKLPTRTVARMLRMYFKGIKQPVATSLPESSVTEERDPTQLGFNYKTGGPTDRGGVAMGFALPGTERSPSTYGPTNSELAAQVADAVAKGKDTAYAVVHRVLPVYPTTLRREAKAGAAQVQFTITETGHPENVMAVSASAPEFGAAAVEALKRWRFIPPIKNGKATRVTVVVPFDFNPDK